MMSMRRGKPGVLLGAAVLLLSQAACDSSGGRFGSPNVPNENQCTIPIQAFADGGVGQDGIPALTDPPLVEPEEADYLSELSRVIGFVVDGQAIAVPHNILWWHEIINFNFGALRLAVTYCPLTGSSLAFDRAAVGGGEFGVSGLLFQNNLTMYDRTTEESLWPQMLREAGCGPRNGDALPMVAIIEATWGGWKALHPDTRVVGENTGFGRCYTCYPYGDYEDPDNDALLFPQPIDRRRPPKERLLGIPDGSGGLAFPFPELDELGPVAAVHREVGGRAVVVFWDRAARGAMAYVPEADGQALTFEARDGRLVDTQTESTWRLDGLASEGPLAGTRLEPIAEAYVAFWFAWAAFHPQTRLFDNAGPHFRLWEGG